MAESLRRVDLRLTIPAGSQSGKRLRLKGRGLPKKGGERGNLEVELRIEVPPEPTAEERRLFEELAKTSTCDPRAAAAAAEAARSE